MEQINSASALGSGNTLSLTNHQPINGTND